MARVTRKIGLSLGADLCWPACYEAIMKRLALDIPVGKDQVSIDVERVSIEPYQLQQPCSYDVVIDRLTHWFHTSREWIKKAVIMDGLYVLNNPWSLQSMEKHTSYAAMMKLGMPVPDTWMLPPREQDEAMPDLQVTLERYAKMFSLETVGNQVGYPFYMKPYDGGAWVGVTRIKDLQQLRQSYEKSGKRVMHLQKAVEPYELFVRCVGIGPQVEIIKYDPTSPLHDRYKVDFMFVDGEQWSLLQDTTLTINTFFGWEFNSCEALLKEKVFYPIDFANACPDFQVTSLHFHFPNMVKNMIRWSTFCAATKRPMRQNLDWAPYYAVQKKDLPFRDRLREYAKIANERLETDKFKEFCNTSLGHLDEVAWEFFGSEEAKTYVRRKVAALFPAHEVEQFTEHFWGMVQFWRKTEADRMNRGKAAAGGAEAAPEASSDKPNKKSGKKREVAV